MKKIFTLLVGVATALGLNAQTIMWNFSNMKSGDITTNTENNGLTIYAGERPNADGDMTTYKWTIDSSNKTFSGVSCSQRLKSNGGSQWNEDGTPFARVMAFTVKGPSTITIAALSASSSATDRTVALYLGDSIDPEDPTPWLDYVVPASGNTLEAQVFEYPDNEPCTILVGVPNGAVNFYYISATNVEGATETPDTPDTPEDPEDLTDTVGKWGDWNFTNWAPTGDIKQNVTINGMTVYAGTRETADGPKAYVLTLDSNSKTIDGVKYTQRIKTNGSSIWNEDGTPFARVFQFSVGGPSTIKVGAISSSSSATDRTVDFFIGKSVDTSDLAPAASIVAPSEGSTLDALEYEYTGDGPATIMIANTNGAINYYFVSATGEADGIENVIFGTEVDAQYYNLQGVRVSADTKGLNVKVSRLSDGTTRATKVYIR